MDADIKNSITNEEMFNAYLTTPENIRYFISSAKAIIERKRLSWEDDCYKNIVINENKAYNLIITTSQTIIKIHELNIKDEDLKNFFYNLMLNLSFNFDYSTYKQLLTNYCPECNDILNKHLFNYIDDTNNIFPFNVQYFINRYKEINKQGKEFEIDCLNEVKQNGEAAFPVILAACQVLLKTHKFKSIDELTDAFGFIMSRIDENFMFENFKTLVTNYSKDYSYLVNAYLFDRTDVSNKVKNYIKSK